MEGQKVASLIKVGFMGNKTEDIMMYLSRVIVILGKKIAIVDASAEQLLKYAIPKINDNYLVTPIVTTYRDVDVYVGHNVEGLLNSFECSKYEFVFMNYGYKSDLINGFMECNFKFAVTDMEIHSVYKLKEMASKINKPSELIRIYRDVVDCKIDKNYLDNLIDSELLKFSQEFALYVDENEMLCRIDSQYNDIFKFNKLPKDFKEMLVQLVVSFGFEKKSALNAFKLAQKGR